MIYDLRYTSLCMRCAIYYARYTTHDTPQYTAHYTPHTYMQYSLYTIQYTYRYHSGGNVGRRRRDRAGQVVEKLVLSCCPGTNTLHCSTGTKTLHNSTGTNTLHNSTGTNTLHYTTGTNTHTTGTNPLEKHSSVLGEDFKRSD